MIAAREFRSDLYYRLNVFPIRIPPLRKRKTRYPSVGELFVQKFAKQMQKKVREHSTKSVMKALTQGNGQEMFANLKFRRTRRDPLTRQIAVPARHSRNCGRSAAPSRKPLPPITTTSPGSSRKPLMPYMGNNSATGDRLKKQRDEIVRAIAKGEGASGRRGRSGGADAYESHNAPGSDEEVGDRSSRLRLMFDHRKLSIDIDSFNPPPAYSVITLKIK